MRVHPACSTVAPKAVPAQRIVAGAADFPNTYCSVRTCVRREHRNAAALRNADVTQRTASKGAPQESLAAARAGGVLKGQRQRCRHRFASRAPVASGTANPCSPGPLAREWRSATNRPGPSTRLCRARHDSVVGEVDVPRDGEDAARARAQRNESTRSSWNYRRLTLRWVSWRGLLSDARPANAHCQYPCEMLSHKAYLHDNMISILHLRVVRYA